MEIKNSIFEEEKEEFLWDKNALKEFKKLIGDVGIKCRMDDIFLLGFLRARKFDLQSSLQLLTKYYNTRANYPQYFKNLLPSKLQNVLDMNILQFLPKPDQNGRYIYIFRFGNWDPSIASATDLWRVVPIVFDLQMNFHRTQKKKIVFIIDGAGLTLSHFQYLSPSVVNGIATLVAKDTHPIRYKTGHYVNLNIIFKAFTSIILPLVSDDFKKRLYFHSDMKTLHEFISPDCLPLEYGGKLPSFDPTESNNMLKANEEFFRRNEEYVKLYEKERNNNVSNGVSKYINEDIEDEKTKQYIERAEEIFQRHSEDPEAFLSCMKKEFKLVRIQLISTLG
ncbi:alpha-tocopherol transfer protein-like isoform X2 [Centruroides sculpturatus]|uniref:alpha-tocopherol transfer protein-like isoform X2 n=1 Tax=Centruroides sculpturatus TaxID=218467 RepID=UPI000C6CF3D9|nr:alpha-tocopherol transfer protein-like isoform X2 [Centruroides sculpturatus]